MNVNAGFALRLRAQIAAALGVSVLACSSTQETGSTAGQASSQPDGSSGTAATAQVEASASDMATAEVATYDSSRVERSTSRPGWKSDNGYCVARVDTQSSGEPTSTDSDPAALGCNRIAPAKVQEIPDAPRGVMMFNEVGTKRERGRVRDACCYVPRPRPPVRGRPLRDANNDPETAPLATRADWADEFEADIGDLDLADRQLLAAEWARDAALEHASIAEFSRVSLGLMSLAAPAALLREAHASALDEARHARMAFGIASFLAARPIGPAPFAAAAKGLEGLDRVALAHATLNDGCVGECVASLLARASAEHAHEPIAERLNTIAEDEARHASFAYQTMRFLIDGASSDERDAIVAIIEEARAELENGLAADPESFRSILGDASIAAAKAQQWGRLTFNQRYSVWRECAIEILAPALDTLAGMAQTLKERSAQ